MNRKELIMQSVDVVCYKHNIKVLIIVCSMIQLFISIICLALFGDDPNELIKALLFYNIIYMSAYLGIILVFVNKLKVLIRNHPSYVLCNVQLSDYHLQGAKYCLSGKIMKGTSMERLASTEAIYSKDSSLANLDYWYNKRALVAYNPEKNKIYVIKLVIE